jgi:hypothetical protein
MIFFLKKGYKLRVKKGKAKKEKRCLHGDSFHGFLGQNLQVGHLKLNFDTALAKWQLHGSFPSY